MTDPSAGDDGGSAPANSFERVLERARERVDPDAEERARLESVVDELVERAEAAVAERCPEADVIRVGSTARNTWVSGDRDVDLFVRFPPDLDRERLETLGLAIGHDVLPEGREEYAEHPYVKGTVEGFDVDVVPCYRLADATDIRSAVDRTPFHTEYLEARLTPDLAADVRLAKGYLSGIGVYGSDLRTRGFSGYLTELLVWEYGGFRDLLEAAADWHPPVRLDPEDHGTARFEDPLVVIDPTDPERNVAAVCDAANVARLQHYARAFLDAPSLEQFDPAEPNPLTEADCREHLARRETTPVALRFDAPDLVDDQLYPQLRKSLAGVVDELDRRGFDVLRADAFVGGQAGADASGENGADSSASGVLLVELSVAERPAIQRHEGPPVHVRDHAEGFFDAYADDPDAYGPFVDGDRYVVERERTFTTARAFLESDRLFDVALGVHVQSALEDGYEVLVGDSIAPLCEPFGIELRRYFEPRP